MLPETKKELTGTPSEGEEMVSLPDAGHPAQEKPVTVRLRFYKTGRLQYISHLDLQRTFVRILSRSGVPVWYTKGFNPHPKLVFGMPLPVGTESVCEFLDIRIDREMPLSEIRERLNACLTDEMKIEEAYLPERKFAEIAFAQYRISIRSSAVTEEFAGLAEKYLTTSPILVTRRGKAGERVEDIVPMIHGIRVQATAGEATLIVMLRAGMGALNPEAIVTVLRERFGILSGNPLEERYGITRQAVYLADGVTEFR